MRTKDIVAIPCWLADKLQRHGLALADLGEIQKLTKVLCLEELALIQALNRKLSDLKTDGGSMGYDLFWVDSLWKKDAFERKPAELEHLDTIAYSEQTERELAERLDVGHKQADGTLYRLVDCERSFCVAVIYPGFFESFVQPRFQYGFVKRVLEIFYVYFGAVKSFELPLFGVYIRLLASLASQPR